MKIFSFDNPLQLQNGEWMLGLTSLEVYKSICKKKTNQKNKFEKSRPNKKERRDFLEVLMIDDENFRPEDLRNETLKTAEFGKVKKLSLTMLLYWANC